jgi:hypothetical protein
VSVRALAAALLALAAIPPPADGGATSPRASSPSSAPTVPAAVATGAPLDVREMGAKGDGMSDDTDAFRRAAATGRPLLVPRPAVRYRVTGTIRLLATIAGEGLPEIRMEGADGSRARTILEVVGHAGPLTIRGLHLHGGWSGRPSPGAEWSHLVSIRGSRGVVVEDNLLERPQGDAVLVGGEGYPAPSEDVAIRRNRIEAPFRCAVALVSARRVRIEGNAIRKDDPYVAAIDLEPNPKDRERVEDVVIAGNTFDVPRGVAILLYSWPENPQVNRRVTVAGNVARARQFVLKPDGTGSWESLAVTGNVYHGDPEGGAGRVSLVEVVQDPAHAPCVARGVTVEGNTVVDAVRRGQEYRDRFDGVEELRVQANRWVGDARYELTVNRSRGAIVEAPPRRR